MVSFLDLKDAILFLQGLFFGLHFHYLLGGVGLRGLVLSFTRNSGMSVCVWLAVVLGGGSGLVLGTGGWRGVMSVCVVSLDSLWRCPGICVLCSADTCAS